MPFLSSLERNGRHTFEEEIPITSTPIFEGHLSVRTLKKQWKWRLFRFDGSNFTCLSTHKIKVTSATSQLSLNNNALLLATPKDKTKRLVEADRNKAELKYYQLPEWTIDIGNTTSISVLKSKSGPSKCFSIRTFDGQHFVLKAKKKKDLERWLFVLTKMWKFAQVVVQQQQQQQTTAAVVVTATAATVQQQAVAVAATVTQQQKQQFQIQQDVVEDNIPLVHSIPQAQASLPQTQATKSATIKTLSSEKIRVIEEWRKSLTELMASDPNIRISTPPPIEPIPDDDTMSIFTDMTSVSNRRPPNNNSTTRTLLKRRADHASTKRSLRRNKTNSIAPQRTAATQEISLVTEQEENRPLLRKRRSDEVRNWMNNNNSSNNLIQRTASVGSNRSKPIIQKISTSNNSIMGHYATRQQQKQHYYYNNNSVISTSPEIKHENINFFQDVTTTVDDSDVASNTRENIQHLLRYHTSVRGKKLIQINQQGEDNNSTLEKRSGLITEPYPSSSLNQDNHDLVTSIKSSSRRASMPLMYLTTQQSLISPLQLLSFNDTGTDMNSTKDDEEEMCLADLQKSLRSNNKNSKTVKKHVRSPSASSIHDLLLSKQSLIVAGPAIPPHQYITHSQQFSSSSNSNNNAAACWLLYEQQQHLFKKQQQQHHHQQQYKISTNNSHYDGNNSTRKKTLAEGQNYFLK